MKNRNLLIALVLVLLVNGVILFGVAGNRNGRLEATLTLTERELSYNEGYSQKENSGISLQLNWNDYAQTESWFDEQKLTDLGFDVEAIQQQRQDTDYYQRLLPRRGFVVLEYAGEAWLRYQAEQETKITELQGKIPTDPEPQKQLNTQIIQIRRDLSTHSRLFAVDAGSDPEALRQRHPQRDRFAVVAAQLGVGYRNPAEQKIKGRIHQVLITSFHVPRSLQGPLGNLPPRKYYSYADESAEANDWQPRYQVRVNWGERFEPWVEAVTLAPASVSGQ